MEMNPNHNRGGMTVNALMQMELILSAALPAIAIILLGFVSSLSDKTTLLLMVVASAIVVPLGVVLINYFVQRRIKGRLLELIDVCRNYVGGDWSVRVAVNGEDEFAQLTSTLNMLFDTQADAQKAAMVAQISQTTQAVEALATFTQNVTRDAQASVEVAQEALRNATSGQQAVRQTIEEMMVIRENVQITAKKIKRLGERSNEIGEIVRIIEDIADQTNLLSLNAAIQSEHGRGFAVVAKEISLLAERSTKSTKRIETLVKSIQGDTYEAVVAMEDCTQEVVKGSQLADETGHSLNTIYSAVERQAKMIENIARAANERSSVSEAVAVAMGQILEITRQMDAGVQEAALSASYLAELAEQLHSSVSTFRLPDHMDEIAGSLTSVSLIAELADSNSSRMVPQSLSS